MDYFTTAWVHACLCALDGNNIIHYIVILPHVVGPCHHGMARPQVADRGTASDREGSCE